MPRVSNQGYHSQVKCHGGSGKSSSLWILLALVSWGFPQNPPPVWFGGFGSSSGAPKESYIQDPGRRIERPESRIEDPGTSVQDIRSWILDPASRILAPKSNILGFGSRTQDSFVPLTFKKYPSFSCSFFIKINKR